MKALAVIVLRFRQPDVERWRVPLNIRVRGVDIPIGLAMITVLLFLLTGINVLTKTTATIAGSLFTLAFFIAFFLSERYHKANKEGRGETTAAGGGDDESETERRLDLKPESRARKARTPRVLRGLLFLFISVFGLLALRLFSSTLAEGWLPTAALPVALGLITVALIEVVRAG